MKNIVKFLSVAVIASLTLVACKNNKTEEATDTMTDTMMEAIDTTIEEEVLDTTTVAEIVEQPVKKATAKKAEEPKNTVSTKDVAKSMKADAKSVASDLKEAENNGTVQVKTEQNMGKKNARDAFKK